MTTSVVFIIFGFMSRMVKSLVDGCWYYDETQWKFILDYLCDALDSFSEADKNCEERIIIDHLADVVSAKIREK